MASYIPDGYCADAVIVPVPRLHEGLRFKYRPALIEESSELYEKTGKQTAKQAERTFAVFVAGRLVEWDLKNQKSEELPHSADVILRLNRRLATKLQNIILGIEASDEGDPIDLEADLKN